MKTKTIFWLLLLVYIHINIVNAQPLASDTAGNIDKIFSGWNESTPGGVIQITRDGQTIYQKAFGMADLEHNTKVSAETIFEAGSVSKQFTAAAVLLLVQQGKIHFTDNLLTYFPDFPVYGKDITIEHLFHHTSGLRDWGSVAEIGGWPEEAGFILRLMLKRSSGGKQQPTSNRDQLTVTVIQTTVCLPSWWKKYPVNLFSHLPQNIFSSQWV